MKELLFIIGVLILFNACETPHGRVVKKEVKPQHKSTRTTMGLVGKITVPMTSTITVPEKYAITIRRIRWQDTAFIEKEIEKELYDKINIGDSL